MAMIIAYAVLLPALAQPGFPLWGPGDFTAFYTAGYIIRDGNAQRLYDLALQTKVQQGFLLPHGWTFGQGLLPFVNPPFFALIFVPFALLPLAWAFHLWNLVNFVLVLLTVGLLLRHLGRCSARDFLTTILITFAFLPVVQIFSNGQSTPLILLALTVTYLALRHNRDLLAGFTLALGLIKPQLVVVLLAILLYHRRWRAVLAFGATGALLLVASWVTVGTEGLMSYLVLMRNLGSENAFYGLQPGPMANLRGTVYRFGLLYQAWSGSQLSPATQRVVTWLLSAVISFLVLRVWRTPWEPASPAFALRFSHTIAGGLLVSPHLFGQDLALLILPAFLVLDYFQRRARTSQAYKMIASGHIAPVISLGILGDIGLAQVMVLLLLAFMFSLQFELEG
jgi:hypothetical protein